MIMGGIGLLEKRYIANYGNHRRRERKFEKIKHKHTKYMRFTWFGVSYFYLHSHIKYFFHYEEK